MLQTEWQTLYTLFWVYKIILNISGSNVSHIIKKIIKNRNKWILSLFCCLRRLHFARSPLQTTAFSVSLKFIVFALVAAITVAFTDNPGAVPPIKCHKAWMHHSHGSRTNAALQSYIAQLNWNCVKLLKLIFLQSAIWYLFQFGYCRVLWRGLLKAKMFQKFRIAW